MRCQLNNKFLSFIFLFSIQRCFGSDCIQSFNSKSDCYIFIENVTYLLDAEETCIKYGGHLASIQDSISNTFITQHSIDYFKPHNYFWIGLTIINGTLKWLDGTDVGFSIWAQNQPVDYMSLHCVSVSMRNGKWFREDCNRVNPFVCKIHETITTTESNIEGGNANCPLGSLKWESKCFIFNENSVPFDDAEKNCVIFGGQLVSINDEDTNNFLTSNMFQETEFWIGLYIVHGNQTWLDESLINYTNWEENQPSCSLSQIYCGIINYTSGQWSVSSDCVNPVKSYI